MRKLKNIAAGIAVSLGLIVAATAFAGATQDNPQGNAGAPDQAGLTPAAAAVPVCKRQSAANGAGQDIALSTADPKVYTGTVWQNVNCTSTSFRLKFGERAVVVADVSAETDCTGSTPTNGQWCQARALLNGIEGSPVAAEPSSFAFDSVSGGLFDWQAHAFNRSWEVRCGLSAGCQYKFVVQTRNHDASVTGLWLDEVAAHIRVTTGAPAPL